MSRGICIRFLDYANYRSFPSAISISSPETVSNKKKPTKTIPESEREPVSQMQAPGSLFATQQVQALTEASITQAPRRHREGSSNQTSKSSRASEARQILATDRLSPSQSRVLEAQHSVGLKSREVSRDPSAVEQGQALTTISNVFEGHQAERGNLKGVLDDNQKHAPTVPRDQSRPPSRAKTISREDVVVISIGTKAEADTSEHAEVNVEYAQMENLLSGGAGHEDNPASLRQGH